MASNTEASQEDVTNGERSHLAKKMSLMASNTEASQEDVTNGDTEASQEDVTNGEQH